MDKLRKKQACLEGRIVHALKTYNDALGKNMRETSWLLRHCLRSTFPTLINAA